MMSFYTNAFYLGFGVIGLACFCCGLLVYLNFEDIHKYLKGKLCAQ